MSKVGVTRELFWGMHASLPALGFETAVDEALVTSPPFAVHPVWNGLASNTDVGTSDFSTNLLTIYETSPIVIFRLGKIYRLGHYMLVLHRLLQVHLFHLSIYLHLHQNSYQLNH